MSESLPVVLTIAGSDCSAGAGAQADLKTFQHFGVFGLTVLTCVVAETPQVVRSVHPVPPEFVRDQLEVLWNEFPIAAIKTGMLFSKAHVETVAEILERYRGVPLVVDPVMIASTGDPLLEEAAVSAYRDRLFPLATVMTPNLDELQYLTGEVIRDEEGMRQAALGLANRHGCAVLAKGGHLTSETCADLLVEPAGEERWFRTPRVQTSASHGTGCTLSAAIAANLARGLDLAAAVGEAKSYLTETLKRPLEWGDLAMLNQGTTWQRTEC